MTNIAERLDYKYTATTGTEVCPDLVSERHFGRHRSAVVQGVRVWWFRKEKGRDRFVRHALNGSFRRPVLDHGFACAACGDTGVIRNVETGVTVRCPHHDGETDGR
ncbi:hypothetical protein BD1_50 [Octadecabacter Antarctic BD virus 1]|nr:hypothetical protein BD1_50 [Octadecabacter Antarctic BD virus 1]